MEADLLKEWAREEHACTYPEALIFVMFDLGAPLPEIPKEKLQQHFSDCFVDWYIGLKETEVVLS